MKKYYDELEVRNPSLREEEQFSSLSKLMALAINKAPGWRRILSGVDPLKIKNRKDLLLLPVTRKSELQSIQAKEPPFGGLSILDSSSFPHIFASPGPIYEPGENHDSWRMARGLYAAGFRKKNIVYNTFSYHLGPAGIMMHQAAHSLGCCVIAGGVGNTDVQIQTIADLQPTGYIGTPSFLRILFEKANENKIDISSLKFGLVGAEPLPPSLRKLLSEYGIEVLQTYGTAECGLISYETKDVEGNIIPGMIVDEGVILEIVRPGTNESLPIGEVGEVVISTINSNYPMFRFGTGDMSAIIDSKSPCGRTGLRIKGWMGRADQTTKVRGIFVHPGQVASVAKFYNEIFRFRLILNNDDNKDQMIFKCEVEKQDSSLQEKIKSSLSSALKLRCEVELVSPGTLKNDGLVIEDCRKYE